MRKAIKMLSSTFVVVLIMSILTSVTLYANEISVTIDGVQVNFEGQTPTIIDGRTLVPIRGVFEVLGFDVDFDNNTRTAILTGSQSSLYSNYEFRVSIGSSHFELNGQSFPLDVSAQIINGRTMLPIRPLLERIGFSVDWNSATRTVIIESPLSPFAEMSREQMIDTLIGTWTVLESDMPTGHHFSSFTLNAPNLGMGDGEVTIDSNRQRISWLINAYGNLVIIFSDSLEQQINYYAVENLNSDSVTLSHNTFERHVEGLASYRAIYTRVR